MTANAQDSSKTIPKIVARRAPSARIVAISLSRSQTPSAHPRWRCEQPGING
jgi:hypothetical protein